MRWNEFHFFGCLGDGGGDEDSSTPSLRIVSLARLLFPSHRLDNTPDLCYTYSDKALPEPNADGSPVHYCPADGEVRPGVRYVDNCFWDTARTVYPLFSVIAREEFAEMLEGFVNDYKDSGWWIP